MRLRAFFILTASASPKCSNTKWKLLLLSSRLHEICRRAHQLLNLLSCAGGAALACGVRQGARAASSALMMIMLFIVLFYKQTSYTFGEGTYCCSAPSVRPRPTAARRARWETRASRCAQPERAVRVCSLTRARSLPPCLHPPATRLPRGRPGTSTSAVRPGRLGRRLCAVPTRAEFHWSRAYTVFINAQSPDHGLRRR